MLAYLDVDVVFAHGDDEPLVALPGGVLQQGLRVDIVSLVAGHNLQQFTVFFYKFWSHRVREMNLAFKFE